MKAAVLAGGVIELREWPEPWPGPGELLLRVHGCGLCGSDIVKIVAAAAAPDVLGHEVVGEVTAVGPGLRRFAPGDRLVVAHHVPCFQCHYCRHGSPSMCRESYHRELTITATYSSSPAELAEAFELLSGGRVRVDGLISHRRPLERLDEGVELMRRHEAVKVYVIA